MHCPSSWPAWTIPLRPCSVSDCAPSTTWPQVFSLSQALHIPDQCSQQAGPLILACVDDPSPPVQRVGLRDFHHLATGTLLVVLVCVCVVDLIASWHASVYVSPTLLGT